MSKQSILSSYASELSLKAKFFVDKERIIEVQLAASPVGEGFQWELIEVSKCSASLKAEIARWMDCYLQKQHPDVILPLALDHLPPFTKRTLSVLHEIPFGVSLSYQKLAAKVGSPRGARAIGNACGRNPFLLVIPCHRVLAANGSLGGFTAGLEIKEQLLAFEGNVKTKCLARDLH